MNICLRSLWWWRFGVYAIKGTLRSGGDLEQDLEGFLCAVRQTEDPFPDGGCDYCLNIELNRPVQMGEHMPSRGEKLYT